MVVVASQGHLQNASDTREKTPECAEKDIVAHFVIVSRLTRSKTRGDQEQTSSLARRSDGVAQFYILYNSNQ
jgi:hypothetical protein